MGMFLTLNLPSLPRWATDTGRRLEPGETDKGIGHVVGTRAVARWNNWLSGENYDWILSQIVHAITEHYTPVPIEPAVAGIVGAIYNPVQGYWIAADVSRQLHYSTNGRNFADGAYLHATSGNPKHRSLAFDTTGRYIVGMDSSASPHFSYGTDPTTGTWTSKAATGFTGDNGLIITDYPTSDAIIATDDDGIILRGTSITASLVAPTTPPSYIDPVSNRIATGLFRVDTDEYVLITEGGECFGTTDSGVTWATRTRVTGATAAINVNSASFSEDTGRIIAVGDQTATSKAISISDDGGTTWSQPTVDPGNGSYDISYYAGQGIWIICGEATPFTCCYSVDDGDTWKPFSIFRYENRYAPGVFACDGARIMLASESNWDFDGTEEECFLLGATIGEQW